MQESEKVDPSQTSNLFDTEGWFRSQFHSSFLERKILTSTFANKLELFFEACKWWKAYKEIPRPTFKFNTIKRDPAIRHHGQGINIV